MKDLDQIYAAALDCDPASYQAGNEKFERFVRAATPVAVGAMIEEIRVLRQKLEAAESALREVREQKPVDLNRFTTGYDQSEKMHFAEFRIKYAKPGDCPDKFYAAPVPAIPDGCVAVPLEPSTEQQTAGAQAVRIDTTAINKLFTANRVYRDMIAAAPKPEGL